jgi:hypothetical protein
MADGHHSRFLCALAECLDAIIGPVSLFDALVEWGRAEADLVKVMTESGLRTILYAGNGVLQEAHALAAGGFDVTAALDISSVAVRSAEILHDDARHFWSPQKGTATGTHRIRRRRSAGRRGVPRSLRRRHRAPHCSGVMYRTVTLSCAVFRCQTPCGTMTSAPAPRVR